MSCLCFAPAISRRINIYVRTRSLSKYSNLLGKYKRGDWCFCNFWGESIGNSVSPSDSSVCKNGSDTEEPEGPVSPRGTCRSPRRGHRGPTGKEGDRGRTVTDHTTLQTDPCLPTSPARSSAAPMPAPSARLTPPGRHLTAGLAALSHQQQPPVRLPPRNYILEPQIKEKRYCATYTEPDDKNRWRNVNCINVKNKVFESSWIWSSFCEGLQSWWPYHLL